MTSAINDKQLWPANDVGLGRHFMDGVEDRVLGYTVQGYDLNYVGVIFGPEITYSWTRKRIEVLQENYKDNLGRAVSGAYEALREYIINIYATLMTRGIRGAFVYVCDPNLRKYLRQYFNT